jgi:hypothetical protein
MKPRGACGISRKAGITGFIRSVTERDWAPLCELMFPLSSFNGPMARFLHGGRVCVRPGRGCRVRGADARAGPSHARQVLDGRPAPCTRTLVRPWARGPSTWDDGCRCVQARPNRPNWADSKTHWTDWTLSNCCHGATAYATITFALILGRIRSRIRRYPASTLRQRAFWAPVQSVRPAVGTMAR